VASRHPLEQQGVEPGGYRRALLQEGRQGLRRGPIEYRSWQDREGQTRYTTEINGRELILLSGKGDGAESFAPSKVAAAAGGAPRKEESLEDFPEALDGEDDDLPF
jgi:Single-stranded DNA-binding protein